MYFKLEVSNIQDVAEYVFQNKFNLLTIKQSSNEER